MAQIDGDYSVFNRLIESTGMREDYMEQLDKMFPDGWICIYTNPNDTVRMSLYNPMGLEILEEYHKLLKEQADEH